jgi:hypothetical protein
LSHGAEVAFPAFYRDPETGASTSQNADLSCNCSERNNRQNEAGKRQHGPDYGRKGANWEGKGVQIFLWVNWGCRTRDEGGFVGVELLAQLAIVRWKLG